MSGEFGDGTFFHDKIRHAAEDAEGGTYAITKAWGKVLEPIAVVAREISYVEAGDSNEGEALRRSFEQLANVRHALWTVELMSDVVRRCLVDGMAAELCSRLETPRFSEKHKDCVLLDNVPRLKNSKPSYYGAPPRDPPSWMYRIRDMVLIEYVEDWARMEHKKHVSFRIGCISSSLSSDCSDYMFEPFRSDEVARLAVEEIRGISDRGGTMEEVREVLDRTNVRELRPA